MTGDDARARSEVERWFLRRGLPHFIEGYSASRDVLTRTLPVLTLIFLFEVANAPKKTYPLWFDAVAVAGGFAILLGAWTVVNVARGRRALARPEDIGPVEVGVFVLVPALIPVVFGQQYAAAVVTAVVNLALLGAVYLVTSYGVVPTIRWGFGRVRAQLESITGLLFRALPLLTLFVTFLFLTAEVWQTAGVLYGPTYAAAIGLFVVVGVVFVIVRLPRDLSELGSFDSWAAVRSLTHGTPAETLARHEGDPDAMKGLSKRQWGNVGLVALFSQGVQIMLVSLFIGVFFVLLGVLLVSQETARAWSGVSEANVLAHLTLGGRRLVVTEEALRVAGFLTAFSGLQFTMNLLTDATYRAEFREEVVGEIRQAFAVRAVYLAWLGTRPMAGEGAKRAGVTTLSAGQAGTPGARGNVPPGNVPPG